MSKLIAVPAGKAFSGTDTTTELLELAPEKVFATFATVTTEPIRVSEFVIPYKDAWIQRAYTVCDAVGVNVAPFEPTELPPTVAVCQPSKTKFARVGRGRVVELPFCTETEVFANVPPLKL